MSVVLETPRLSLVPWMSGMVTERHVRWLNTKELMRYSEQRHKSHSVPSQRAYVSGFNTPTVEGDERIWDFLWLIRTPIKDIGSITAYVDYDNKKADLGILIAEDQHHGYGAEAWHAVMRYVVDGLGVYKINAGTMASNRAMIKLALKCGMFIEGTVPDHFDLDGEPEDLVLLGGYFYGKSLTVESVLRAFDVRAEGR